MGCVYANGNALGQTPDELLPGKAAAYSHCALNASVVFGDIKTLLMSIWRGHEVNQDVVYSGMLPAFMDVNWLPCHHDQTVKPGTICSTTFDLNLHKIRSRDL